MTAPRWLLAGLLTLTAWPAQAADLFMLSQKYGSIGFSVRHLGAFTSVGAFPRFMGRLLIDRLHPEQTKIDVEADATKITVPWPDGDTLLRGPEFFDVEHFPAVHFVSEAVRGVDPKHFLVDGMLEIRGIKRPLTLDATLRRQEANPTTGTEIADFTITGTLSRAAFGMTSQQMMISDEVNLLIAARVELPPQGR